MEVNFVRMISYPAELRLRYHTDHLRTESGTDTAMWKGGIPRKGTSFWFKTATLFKVIGGSASLLNPIPATTTKVPQVTVSYKNRVRATLRSTRVSKEQFTGSWCLF